MTERSWFWGGTTTGDAALSPPYGAPYSDDMFSDIFSYMLTTDRTSQGVFPSERSGYDGMLDCTYTNSTVTVATGIGVCDGKLYSNSASVDLNFSGDGTWYAVMRKSWSSQTVRLALVSSVTQTDGTTWDVPLHSFVRSGGSVTTYTDLRVFVGQRPRITNRRGGDSAVWGVGGTTNYSMQFGQYLIQIGCAAYSSTDTGVSIELPVAYPASESALVFGQIADSSEELYMTSWWPGATTNVIGFVFNTAASTSGVVNWMTIGPAE